MKSINKHKIKIFGAVLLVLAATGCGSKKADLERPYDIYGMAAGNIALSENKNQKTLFANGLCVADDMDFGTESTTSKVAQGAGVFNLATKTVTYGQNIYGKLYPASTTKIMTAYLVLKYCEDLETKVTVSENAATQEKGSSVCGVNTGDVISVNALLYGLMLSSGNDAAIALAEQISGSAEAFAELMNQEALSLGATQSHFVNPNGLPDENHYTSVYDLYLIFQKAIQDERFVNLISATSYEASYTDAEGNPVNKKWENTNQYFTGYASAPEGITVIGGKTGTTQAAGYCLALYSMNAKGEPILSIVLKADGKADLYLLMNEMLQGFAGN